MIPLEPGKVTYRTIIKLVRQAPIMTQIGLVVLAMSVFSFLLVALMSPLFVDNSVPNVDYDRVDSKGTITEAKIKNVLVHWNVEINGKHPVVVWYKFNANGRDFESSSEILPLTPDSLRVGDPIKIKFWEEESIIVGYDRNRVPWNLFFLVFGGLFLVGVALVWPGIKQMQKDLYKYPLGN